MARITKSFARTVTDGLLKEALREEAQQIREEAKDLAALVYEDIYKNEIDAMGELPDGFLFQKSSITVDMAGDYTVLSFDGRHAGFALSVVGESPTAVYLPVSWAHRHHSGKNYPPSSKTYKRFQRLERAAKEFSDKYARLRVGTNAAILAARTYKRLAEEWPEIEPWIAKHAPTSTRLQSKALAVDRAALNEALKLNGDSEQ